MLHQKVQPHWKVYDIYSLIFPLVQTISRTFTIAHVRVLNSLRQWREQYTFMALANRNSALPIGEVHIRLRKL